MISIVTPSFKQLDWLRLAVASVADQEGVEVEHIIQDAESGFDAAALPGAKIEFFIEHDAGMYDAINRGLRRARGEICAYLNCDEQYLPGTLARVARFFAEEPEIDLLFADALIVSPTGEALAYRRAITPTRAHIRASHLNVYTCATFFRRRLIDEGHLPDPKWKSIGDAIWIDRMLTEGVRSATLPELVAVFTLTGQNLSTVDPVSEEEKKAWLAKTGGLSRAGRWREVLLHRLRKLAAGAYRRRTFEYRIYTRDSPERRLTFRANNIPATWPQDG